jgi:uncharacterized RDD family membrane protein YckC
MGSPAPAQSDLAGWWSRAGALVIDAVLITTITTAILFVAGFDFAAYYSDSAPLLLAARGIDLTYLVVDAAVAAAYYVPLMRRWDGQTIGKRALHVRVVRADGHRLDGKTVFVRQVLMQYLLLGLVPLLLIIDYLLPLFDRSNRAGHDLVARTRVVRDM